jgi:hypothetical protein
MTATRTRTDPAAQRNGAAEPAETGAGLLLGRPLPSRIDMEQRALGAALIRPASCDRLLERLRPEHFDLLGHRLIYVAIATLAERSETIFSLSVAEELKERGQLETVGGMRAINDLVDSVEVASEIDYYCDRVLDAAGRRHLIATCSSLIEAAYDAPGEAGDLLASAGVEVGALAQGWSRAAGGPRVYTAAELETLHFAPTEWLLENLMPEAAVGLLAGWPKCKKTFFAGDFGAALAQGGVALGRYPVQRRGALMCLTEDPIEDAKSRLARVLETGWPEHLHVTEDCPRMDQGGEAWLHQWLPKHPDVRYVVLDPLVNVRGAGRNTKGNAYYADNDDMAAFRRIARRHRVFLLVLHHVTKLKQDDPFACISGSNAILGSVDVAMVLMTDDTVTQGKLHVKGRKVRPQTRYLSWDERWGWTERESTPGEDAPQEYEKLVRYLMDRDEPARHHDILRFLLNEGVRENTGKSLIKRAKELGIISGDAGLYWLRGSSNSSNQRNSATPATSATAPAYASADEPPGGGEAQNAQLQLDNGCSTVALVAEVAEVAEVAGVAEVEAVERYAVLQLANQLGFPERTVEGRTVPAGEAAWSHATKTLHLDWMPWLRAALEVPATPDAPREGDGLTPESATSGEPISTSSTLSLEEEESTTHAREEGQS